MLTLPPQGLPITSSKGKAAAAASTEPSSSRTETGTRRGNLSGGTPTGAFLLSQGFRRSLSSVAAVVVGEKRARRRV